MKRNFTFPILMAAIALILRLIGIGWGEPGHEGRYYHPDERHVNRSLAQMDPLHGDLNPDHMINPALFYYLTGAAILADRSIPSPFHSTHEEFEATPHEIHGKWIRKGRLVCAILGSIGVLLAGLASTAAFGRAAGAATAILLTINPAHLVQSHYSAVDVPAIAFFLGALLLGLLYLRDGKWKSLYAAAFVAGLAVATKYIAGLLLPALLLAPILRRESTPGRLGAVTVIFGAGIVIGFPAILDFETFLGPNGIRRLFSYYPFPDTVPTPVLSLLLNSFGLPLALFGTAGIVRAASRRTRPVILLLALLGMYSIFLLRSPSPFHRHYLPLVAIVSLFAGEAAGAAWLSRKTVLRALTTIAVLYGLIGAVRIDQILLADDVRDEAGAWIGKNLQRGTTIGVSGPKSGRGFFTATIDPEQATVAVLDYDLNLLDAYGPDYILLTDVEIRVPTFSGADGHKRQEYLETLLDGNRYRVIRLFHRPLSHGPISYLFDPLPTDYAYFRPEISVLEKITSAPWSESLREARLALSAGDTTKATSDLEKIIHDAPGKTAPRILLSEIRIVQGKCPESIIPLLEDALAIGLETRRETPVHVTLAKLYADLGEEHLAAGDRMEATAALRRSADHYTWVRKNAVTLISRPDLVQLESLLRRRLGIR